MKFGRQAHGAQSLAITFRMGAAIEAVGAFAEGVALLVANQHHAVITQAGKAAAEGTVVPDGPVAMQLDKALEDQVDVIERLRAVAMAGYQHRFPGTQVAVDLPFE